MPAFDVLALFVGTAERRVFSVNRFVCHLVPFTVNIEHMPSLYVCASGDNCVIALATTVVIGVAPEANTTRRLASQVDER